MLRYNIFFKPLPVTFDFSHRVIKKVARNANLLTSILTHEQESTDGLNLIIFPLLAGDYHFIETGDFFFPSILQGNHTLLLAF